MSNNELSSVAMHRICKKAGAERVSKSAVKELAKVLEDIGIKITERAIDYAMHAGRKIVKDRDIKIATKKTFSTK